MHGKRPMQGKMQPLVTISFQPVFLREKESLQTSFANTQPSYFREKKKVKGEIRPGAVDG